MSKAPLNDLKVETDVQDDKKDDDPNKGFFNYENIIHSCLIRIIFHSVSNDPK